MARQTVINVPQTEAKPLSLHETVLAVLDRYGPRKAGHLAAQLGASESHLCEVKKGLKHWPAEWLDYIVEHYDFEAAVAVHFARLRKLEVRPPRKATAAERLRRLEYVLSQHNGIGKALRDEAAALPDEVFADEEGA